MKLYQISASERNVTDMADEGNLVGPLVFRDQDAPSYAPGFITLVVTSLSTCILAITYRFSCMWTNRKRGQAGTLESYENVLDSDLTDKKVRRRVSTGAAHANSKLTT